MTKEEIENELCKNNERIIKFLDENFVRKFDDQDAMDQIKLIEHELRGRYETSILGIKCQLDYLAKQIDLLKKWQLNHKTAEPSPTVEPQIAP